MFSNKKILNHNNVSMNIAFYNQLKYNRNNKPVQNMICSFPGKCIFGLHYHTPHCNIFKPSTIIAYIWNARHRNYVYVPRVDVIYKCYYGGSCSHVMTNLLCYSILVYVAGT